jgi:hypothetical protein
VCVVLKLSGALVLIIRGIGVHFSFFMIAFASYVEMQAEDNFKQSFSEWLNVRIYFP